MKVTTQQFREEARKALGDEILQRALAKAKPGFINKRKKAVDALPEFDALRADARAITEHALAHLDYYLERFEANVVANGGVVHWARTADEANQIILGICEAAGAHSVIKGKSMIAEEMALNESLEGAGLEVVETDLGEYIIQLAEEHPSHIIAPAAHKTREQITELFYKHHRQYGKTKRQTEPKALVDEARSVLRDKFLNADVGITGANFLVAESGANVLVTNEGNGDLTSTLPRVHIVTAAIDKVIPDLEDLSTLLRVLARSATGQEMSSYTTLYNGSRRPGDLDGPEEYHVVLLDNGRSALLGSEFHEMLRCIRCGACLNHCPVYGAIGGHAYGWVYPGPMGAVLTSLMLGTDEAPDLANACSLNGRCNEVCPLRIPLPRMLRDLRAIQFQQGGRGVRGKFALQVWAFFASRPNLYHASTSLMVKVWRRLAGKRGVSTFAPFAGGWTAHRDLPVPEGKTFTQRWKRERGRTQ